MNSRRFTHVLGLVFLASPLVFGCSSDDTSPTNNGGSTATGGTGGSAGASGSTSGSAGAPGGAGGTTGGGTTGGSAGTSSGGSAGATSGSAGASSGSGPGGAGAGGTGGAGLGGTGGAGGSGGASPGGSGGKAGASGAAGSSGSGGQGAFTVTSSAFANMPGCAANMAASCATFPRDNTSFGANISPAMTWTGAPAGTQSFVVLMQDLTNGMAHWVLWNIPASVTSLAENVPKGSAMPATPAGSQQCSIGQGDGYFGSGACGNVYEFVIYALSIPTFSPTMATNQTQVRMQLQALGAQILGTASMRARSFQPEC